MKVIVATSIHNEADIVETFVRHHAELVDELILPLIGAERERSFV
jgi:hypothetical protein